MRRRFAWTTRLAIAVVVVLTACGGGSPAETATPASAVAAPPAPTSPTPSPVVAPPEDARVRAARDRAARGELPAAVTTLRGLSDDVAVVARVRGEARLALVELWLTYEDGRRDAAACLPPATPRVPGAPARDFMMPPRLGARRAARIELECARAAGLDVDAARARLDAQTREEAARCTARGDRPMEGNAFTLGAVQPADPCATGPVRGAFGPTVSELDQRLGVAPLPSPFGADLFNPVPRP